MTDRQTNQYTDGPTDQRTNEPTNGRTNPLLELQFATKNLVKEGQVKKAHFFKALCLPTG